jgi:hypothetical protein
MAGSGEATDNRCSNGSGDSYNRGRALGKQQTTDVVTVQSIVTAGGMLWESNGHRCNGSGDSYNMGHALGRQWT